MGGMSALNVLGIELLVGVGVFLFAYGAISLTFWSLSRASRRRARERGGDRAGQPGGAGGPRRS